MLYRPNIHKNQHTLENAMTSILRGPATSIRALILIAVYVAAANIPCYTAPSHKVMPRLIFVPPVDSRHNPTATQTGHSSRNSGDHKMLTTSDPGSNLPTHKLWVLGRTPIKPHVLHKYLSCYPNTLIAKKLSLGFSQGFQLHYWGPRIHLESKNLISAYAHHNELKEKITKEVELGHFKPC